MEENIQKIQEYVIALSELADLRKDRYSIPTEWEWKEQLVRFKLSTELTAEEKQVEIKNIIDTIQILRETCTNQIIEIKKRKEDQKPRIKDKEYMKRSQTARWRLRMLRDEILNVFPEGEEEFNLPEEKTETKRTEKKPKEENTREIPPESIDLKSWLTLDEVCSSFKLAKNNVKDRKWRDKYDFPYHQAGGVYGTVTYNREEIEDWMKEQ